MSWEYEVINFRYGLYNNDEALQGTLNKLGSEGWELVSVTPIVEGSSDGESGSVGTNNFKLFLKRSK